MAVLKNVLIALDQALNCLIRLDGEYGQPDEMLSARAWRMRHTHPRLQVWIDRLWFWDDAHCRECWEIERERKQLPQTYEFDT